MRILWLCGIAALSLSACATTKREEVRNDMRHLDKSRDNLQAAERDGSVNDVRKARKEVRNADRDLRKDQNELYRPGAEGLASIPLERGQPDNGRLQQIPQEYRSQYQDSDSSYYRSDGTRIYRISSSDHLVTDVYPVNP